MRKISVLAVMVLLVSSCSWFGEKEKPAIEIGKVKISPEEFQREFEWSNLAKEGKKREFLETFISRKLILLEAEKLGLDKNLEFLHDVQNFWEQALLKSVIAKKIEELTLNIEIGEEEVKSYYQENKAKEFVDKELKQVSEQIKGMLLRDKQKDVMQNWADSLQIDTEVIIDYKLLGLEEN